MPLKENGDINPNRKEVRERKRSCDLIIQKGYNPKELTATDRDPGRNKRSRNRTTKNTKGIRCRYKRRPGS